MAKEDETVHRWIYYIEGHDHGWINIYGLVGEHTYLYYTKKQAMHLYNNMCRKRLGLKPVGCTDYSIY